MATESCTGRRGCPSIDHVHGCYADDPCQHRGPAGEVLGELTGLPLSKFATAEMVAKARARGFHSLWDYVAHLEDIERRTHEVGRLTWPHAEPYAVEDGMCQVCGYRYGPTE